MSDTADPPWRPNPEIPRARIWLRAVATLVDAVLLLTIFFFWGVQFAWGHKLGFQWAARGRPACAVILFAPIYLLLLRTTPGKLLCDLRIRSTDGGDVPFHRIVGRNFLKCLEWPVLFLPSFVMVASNPERQSPPDRAARTIVVEDAAFKAWKGEMGDVAFDAWLKSMKVPKGGSGPGQEGGPA